MSTKTHIHSHTTGPDSGWPSKLTKKINNKKKEEEQNWRVNYILDIIEFYLNRKLYSTLFSFTFHTNCLLEHVILYTFAHRSDVAHSCGYLEHTYLTYTLNFTLNWGNLNECCAVRLRNQQQAAGKRVKWKSRHSKVLVGYNSIWKQNQIKLILKSNASESISRHMNVIAGSIINTNQLIMWWRNFVIFSIFADSLLQRFSFAQFDRIAKY